MKIIQDALKPVIDLGVPVMEGIWKTETKNQNPPKQYIVYSATTTEKSFWDDRCRSYKTLVYIDFWSKIETTVIKEKVRECMYNAGFVLESESTKGYNMPAYDNFTHQYCIQWQWIIETEEMP